MNAVCGVLFGFFFFSSRRRHTRCGRDWSSDVCSSDLNNLLPNSNASWRNPVLETSNGIQYIYVDGNGERSKVILSLDTTNPNVFSPVPQNNNLVQYDSLSGEYYIYPEQLQSVEDFIDLFEPSWSSSLVVYHPEYCYYET